MFCQIKAHLPAIRLVITNSKFLKIPNIQAAFCANDAKSIANTYNKSCLYG